MKSKRIEQLEAELAETKDELQRMTVAFDEKEREYKQASCLVMSLEKQVEEQGDEIEQLKIQL